MLPGGIIIPSSIAVNTHSEPGNLSHVKACAASRPTKIVRATEMTVTKTLLTK